MLITSGVELVQLGNECWNFTNIALHHGYVPGTSPIRTVKFNVTKLAIIKSCSKKVTEKKASSVICEVYGSMQDLS